MSEKIVDCFMFRDEWEILEIRLNSLAPYVDRFVLCECPITHTGIPKPLYFDENKDRFKEFNISHLIFKGYEGIDFKTIVTRGGTGDAWVMDSLQRDYLINGFRDEDPETMIFMSDIDEIPNMKIWSGAEGVFKHKVYYFYLNAYSGSANWRGTVALKRKNITSVQWVRENKRRIAGNRGRGWHYSSQGTADRVMSKIKAFTHQEFNTQEVRSKIDYYRETLRDPYGRSNPPLVIMPLDGPDWLLKNRDRYVHLIYQEECHGNEN